MAGSAPPRLVATDLDGTLLRTDGTVSPRTRAALAAAEQAGIQVVFVTARPPRWLSGLTDMVGGHGLAICANGAIVYDVARQQIVSISPVDPETVTAVVAALRGALPDTVFASEQGVGFAMEPDFQPRHPLPPGFVVGPIETLLAPPPAKLLARNEALPNAEFIARSRAVVAGLVEVHVSGATGLLEMSAPGVSKAAALARWCHTHRIEAADVWAFGDMFNDLEMLRWAGTSFAMANAHPDVIAAATAGCASNDDDGVAQMIEHAVDTGAATLSD